MLTAENRTHKITRSELIQNLVITTGFRGDHEKLKKNQIFTVNCS